MNTLRVSTRDRALPGWLTGVLIFGTAAALVALELKRPLRRSRQDKVERNLRNLTLAAASAATVHLVEKPVTASLAAAVERRRFGILKLFPLPVAAELMLSVLLLDYTLYLWHYLTHKVPLLWRFHQAHHADLDMDASTALRFHFGEILLSVPWRGAQVALLGISPGALSLWQGLTLLAILFHHANLRLPIGIERSLSRAIVTPRMHGIHHSAVVREADSNWATIFSWPDYLHGTALLNVPQEGITIGVTGYQKPSELTLEKVFLLPFSPTKSRTVAVPENDSEGTLPEGPLSDACWNTLAR